MRFRRAVMAVAGLGLVGVVVPVLAAAPAHAACATDEPCTVIDQTTGTPKEAGAFQETWSTTATFTLGVDGSTDRITYECKLDRPGGPGSWAACTSPATYPGLSVGGYKFSARAIRQPVMVLGVPLGNPEVGTEVTYLWDVIPRPAGSLEGDPVTSLGNVPARWHTATWFSVDLNANEDVSGFVCRLDGKVRSCGLSQFNVFGTGQGDHTISVAAIDIGGNPDTTPAIANFTVPKSAAILDRPRGWIRRTGQGYMNDTYLHTTKQGAAIKHGFRGKRQIVAVLSKGPGHGTLKVYLGTKLVKRISLNAAGVRHRQVVVLKSFKKKTRGSVRLVVASRGKPVYVEGLGFSAR